MSASNEMKRYRLSYRHGVIEEDGSPRSCDDSKPMYLCAEADAALLAKDEVIEGLRSELAILRDNHTQTVENLGAIREAHFALQIEMADAKMDAERYR